MHVLIADLMLTCHMIFKLTKYGHATKHNIWSTRKTRKKNKQEKAKVPVNGKIYFVVEIETYLA